jgi:hypothetical protein
LFAAAPQTLIWSLCSLANALTGPHLPNPWLMNAIIAISAALVSLATARAGAQRAAVDGRVEDIYVARSVRLSRVSPTDYCAERRTALRVSRFEDQYDFKAVTTRSADGAVASAAGRTVGHLHACIGRISDSLIVWFAQGDLNGIQFTGRGDCRSSGHESPEPGITPLRCYLDLTALPTRFAGGQLTTNTITSRATLGLVSDPHGYVQPSIATVRVWRTR